VYEALVAAILRAIHVLSMAILVGGPLAVSIMLRAPVNVATLLRLEKWIWAAAGLIVLTGIGNVGYLGSAFPAPTTPRGAWFLLKFALVALLLVLSLIRTMACIRLAARNEELARRRTLARWYATTGTLGGGIAGLGLLLAHGGL
jgi:putative copper export protein